MKILLVHEYYRSSSPSGEDKVYEKEMKLLKDSGLKVESLVFRNDWIGTKQGHSVLKTALYTPWSPVGKSMIRDAIRKFHPDVVHFHNTFPVFSQSAIIQAKRMGVPTVQTLHNFRTICAQAILMRNSNICNECVVKKSSLPALTHRCYRNSFFATLPLALNISLHRILKTWQTKVDRIIVLSEFNRKVFESAGFPVDKLRVKPNFFKDWSGEKKNIEESLKNWIFIGRLQDEKGVQFLPSVWKKFGKNAPTLNVVGDGPLKEWLNKQIISLGLEKKIILHGLCAPSEVNSILGKSSLLVFPSICYEGFPLVIGEAYTAGVPVAASKLGTPEYIVKNGVTGVHFEHGNIDDMVRVLSKLIENPESLIEMGKNAQNEYKREYTAEKNFKMILEIYNEAIEENKRSLKIA